MSHGSQPAPVLMGNREMRITGVHIMPIGLLNLMTILANTHHKQEN